jgi:hypothetical protein
MALATDRSVKYSAGSGYRVDTGGTPPMGAVHHLSRFGFVAFPYGQEAGRLILKVNGNNTVISEDLRRDAPPIGFKNPPGLKNTPARYLEWPDDEVLKRHYNRLK